MKNFLYNKKMKSCMRILSLAAIIALLSFLAYNFFCFNDECLNIEFIAQNFLFVSGIILFAFLLVFPERFGLISVICFLYIVLVYPFHFCPIGVLMFVLSMLLFKIRGFFMSNARLKISIFVLAFTCVQLTSLRFGFNFFFEVVIRNFCYAIVFFLQTFFAVCLAKLLAVPEKRVLNVAEYKDLRESDVYLLQCVLNNVQYKKIAIDVSMQEGSVRNRLNKVYDILGVADRIGFITTYSGFSIVYDETAVQA